MKKKDIEEILITVNPNVKNYLNKEINFVDNGILDSFDIMNFIMLIEKKSKKKINFASVKRETFYNMKSIIKFFNKI